MEGGYIIPHQNSFGPEDDSFSLGVEHIGANTSGADLQEPHFCLTLLKSREHGYEADRANAPKPKLGGLGGMVRKGFGKRR